jgi:hypothetical protein
MSNPFTSYCSHPVLRASRQLAAKGGDKMAKTEKGKKIVTVKPYTKVVDGKKVKVKPHRRSTPN